MIISTLINPVILLVKILIVKHVFAAARHVVKSKLFLLGLMTMLASNNFLSMREIGAPSAERKAARFLEGTISSNSGEER